MRNRIFYLLERTQIRQKSFRAGERAMYSYKGPQRCAVVFSNSNSWKMRHDRRCNYRSNRNYRKPLPRDYVKRCSQFWGLLPQRFAYPELEGQEIDSFFRAIVFTLHPPSFHSRLPFFSMKSFDFESLIFLRRTREGR